VSDNIKAKDTTLFDTSATISVSVLDPTKPATAYVWIVNKAGNDTVLSLHYSARLFSYSLDSLVFPMRPPLNDTCRTVFVRNKSAIDTVTVTTVRIKDTNFTVTPLRSLPVRMLPGDSLGVSVCFGAKVLRAIDTLHVSTECDDLLLPVSGSTFYRSIYATDWDFGRLPVGVQRVHSVNVKNVGKSDVTLTKNWTLHDTRNFAFVDSAKLPLTLKPGKSVDLNFAYVPRAPGIDSTWFDWGTDLVAPYEHSEKAFSKFWGAAVMPGLAWSRPIAAFGTWDRLEDTITLLNPSDGITGQNVFVDSVVIRGPSASDFTIVDNELHLRPFINFDLAPQERTWVKIRFAPNDTVSDASPRRDTLYAFDQSHIWPYILLNGYVGIASVRSASTGEPLEFIPKPNALECRTSEPGWRITCYDALGRELGPTRSVRGRTTFDLTSLPPGLYVFVATNGPNARTYRLLR
jgi:hypothetical protein